MSWINDEETEQVALKLFEVANLPDVAEKDLEPGTYNNRKIAEMAGSATRLALLLAQLSPHGCAGARRSILSFAVEMNK